MAAQNLVIFDIDGTLIKGQSQRALLKFLYRRKYIGILYYARIMFWFVLYKLNLIKNPVFVMEYAFSFFKNTPIVKAESIIDEFFKSDLNKWFFKDALDLIYRLKKDGNHIILVSNSINLIVKKIAQYVGADNFIGTGLSVENGSLTGQIDGGIMYGEAKKTAVKKYAAENGFSLTEARAYSDHISDIPMLELVGHPFVVNPSREFLLTAKKHGWPVLVFKDTR